MKKILVLCTGNSARSQMAHGYLQHFADTAGRGESAQVYSADVAHHGVNSLAIQPGRRAGMAEDGIDISHHTARRPGSNHADEYTSLLLDYVITVCDNAREQCPFFPSTGKKVHHSFTDPGRSAGAVATSFHAPGRPAGADGRLAQYVTKSKRTANNSLRIT